MKHFHAPNTQDAKLVRFSFHGRSLQARQSINSLPLKSSTGPKDAWPARRPTPTGVYQHLRNSLRALVDQRPGANIIRGGWGTGE